MRNHLRALTISIAAVVGVAVPGVARATVAPDMPTYAQGDVLVLDTATDTATITHSGGGTDTIQTMSQTGCGRFTVVPATALPVMLTGTQSLTFALGYTPNARIPSTCTVTLRDPGGVALTSFMITGRGVAPVMVVDPVVAAFGTVRLGDTPTIDLLVENITTDVGQDLVLTYGSITGTGAGSYSYVVSPDEDPIAPGDSRIVTVTYAPIATGTHNAGFSISGNDPLNLSDSVTLSGTGQSAVIEITPSPRSFGVVNRGATATSTVQLRNTGVGGTLNVASAAIAGGQNTWFSFTGSPVSGCLGLRNCTYAPLILAPNGTQNIGVQCHPPAGASGTGSSTLTFTSDATSGTNTVTLQCTAGDPMIEVSANTLAFGNVAVGATPTMSLVVTNNAAATGDLTYTSTKSGSARFTYTNPCSPCTLAPGATRTHVVTFAPTAHGAQTGTLSLDHDDTDAATDPIDVALSGTGTGGFITLVTPSDGSLEFGNVSVGTPETLPVTVRNDGNATLSITGITFNNPALTAPNATFPIAMAATGTEMIDVRCAPTARGLINATMSIASTAYNVATLQVTMTCTGTGGQLTVSDSTITFGNVPQDTTATRTVQLQNIGEELVTIDQVASVITPDDVGYDFLPGDEVPATLAAGATVDVTVRFSPVQGVDGGLANLPIVSDAVNLLSISIDGNGVSNGLDLTGNGQFGDVRWDTTADRTITITNSGESTYDITVGGLTNTTDFSLQRITRPGQSDCTAFPCTATLDANEAAVLTVRTNPNDAMLGTFTGSFTISTTSAVIDDEVVDLSVTSVSPMLVAPENFTLDLGAVDVDAGVPAIVELEVGNSGMADLNVVSRNGVTLDPAFTLDAFVAGDVTPAGAPHVTTVTFAPTAAGTYTGTFVLNIDGLYDMAAPQTGPTAVMFTVTGQGIDRELSLASAVEFPPTYRNPGSAAPVRPITVQNLGAAPLAVSMVMLSGDAAFTLVDSADASVPGGGAVDYQVRFAPTAASGTFTATLGLMHDDDDQVGGLLATVTVTGTAVSREVMVPTIVDVGVTGVGIPVQLPDVLTVTNLTTTTGFQIRVVELAAPSPEFSLPDAAARALPASATERYAVAFAPTTAGLFEADVNVYLDEDPEAHAVVRLRGYAVGVTAQGGGGCQTGGGGHGAWMLVAVGALLWRRRRRAAVTVATTLAAVTVVPQLAAAQPARDLDVISFRPLPSIEEELVQVETASVGRAGAWAVGLLVTHATDPLVVEADCGGMCPATVVDGQRERPISAQTVATLGAAFVPLARLELGLTIPLVSQTGEQGMFSGAPADVTALGDIAVHVKGLALARGAARLGGGVILTVPTGDDEQFAGSSSVTAHAQLIGSWRNRRMLASVNGGMRLRPGTDFGDVSQANEVTYGAGVGYRLMAPLWLSGELFGAVPTASATTGSMPLQATLGVRYRLTDAFAMTVGGGTGVMAGVGVPAARVFAALSFSPKATPEPALRPPPPPLDVSDVDGDGIVAHLDKCPTEAEDADLFDDTDGCVDLDNDNDGVIDTADRCVLDPEDRDQFQDDDGCPDADNDNDGVADATDRCALEPEDADGFDDLDGCPDGDNDGDGILDAADKCRDEAETINANTDEDGCPDDGDGAVLLAADRLDLLEAVTFTPRTAKLTKPGLLILGQVASTLRAHSEIARVRVGAHVASRGNKDAEQRLTVERAEAVRDWLVQWGIDAKRLEVRGFGADKPLIKGGGKTADQVNERIEIIILEKE